MHNIKSMLGSRVMFASAMEKSTITIAGALILMFMAADGVLLRQNILLKRELKRTTRAAVLEAGTSLSPLRGAKLDGSLVTYSYSNDSSDNRKTVVFVFSTECPISSANWPRWNYIANGLDPKRYRVVFANISNSLSTNYLALHGLSGSQVISKVDPAVAVEYKLNMTPLAVLISPQGRVEKAWVGMLKEPQLLAMEGELGVLPRLIN